MAVGPYRVNLVDQMSSQLDNGPFDGESNCVCLGFSVHVGVVMGIGAKSDYCNML